MCENVWILKFIMWKVCYIISQNILKLSIFNRISCEIFSWSSIRREPSLRYKVGGAHLRLRPRVEKGVQKVCMAFQKGSNSNTSFDPRNFNLKSVSSCQLHERTVQSNGMYSTEKWMRIFFIHPSSSVWLGEKSKSKFLVMWYFLWLEKKRVFSLPSRAKDFSHFSGGGCFSPTTQTRDEEFLQNIITSSQAREVIEEFVHPFFCAKHILNV